MKKRTSKAPRAVKAARALFDRINFRRWVADARLRQLAWRKKYPKNMHTLRGWIGWCSLSAFLMFEAQAIAEELNEQHFIKALQRGPTLLFEQYDEARIAGKAH